MALYSQYNAITVDGKICVVTVAALSNPNEGLDGDYNISLLAREQLEVLAKLAGNDGTSDFANVKYLDATGKKMTVTLSDGREINVVATAFVK
ncbi:MAG TPA: hypothetical protein DCZ94_02455 [Lentisphaeria bacterium]|nr:MAG: hypothetical protein A2X48_16095 [Lentisphaerae bacterium GWF2_49_21]HBC85796.1 hypothetical protein [Lentisphaeria bacterium]